MLHPVSCIVITSTGNENRKMRDAASKNKQANEVGELHSLYEQQYRYPRTCTHERAYFQQNQMNQTHGNSMHCK